MYQLKSETRATRDMARLFASLARLFLLADWPWGTWGGETGGNAFCTLGSYNSVRNWAASGTSRHSRIRRYSSPSRQGLSQCTLYLVDEIDTLVAPWRPLFGEDSCLSAGSALPVRMHRT
jgi:hypothetical protein